MNSELQLAKSNQLKGTSPTTIHLIRKNESDTFLPKLVFWSWIIFGLSVIFQCLNFWSEENLFAMSCIAITWLILTQLFLTKKKIEEYPLSSFLIIGYVSAQLYFPLVFTSFEYKPVVFNLELPYEVFFHSTAAVIVLVIAHGIYSFIPINKNRGADSLLYKAGFFTTPAEISLWIMGAVGLLANIYVLVANTSVPGQVSGDAGDKIIQSLFSFSYAPYFIPFYGLYGSNKIASKRLVPWLIAFTLALFIISIARNSRGAFMIGFTSVGFAYLLGLFLGIFKPPKIAYKLVIMSCIGLWIITGPLADLGTAMVIVRGDRNDISRSELIDLTISAFSDKEAINLRRLEDMEYESDWDERYLNNVFTSRFSNLKFSDASLVQAAKIGEKNPLMYNYSIDYIWGALPGPILKIVKPSLDKEAIYSISFGDFIYSLTGAGSEVFGGFRLGHFAGTGMASFGWWYLAFLGIGMIPVFYLLDKLSIKRQINYMKGKLKSERVNFSICGLLCLTSIFQFLPTESVVGPATFLIRGYIQLLILYWFIFQLTNAIIYLIKKI
ncbi:hypothetical protein IWX76_003588 [Pedobacter sp. CAN_A7]|uniref:hypothetical protein n=1 Tax=Pedobacter sp. CAN_A7 TaxID=2787722 RepID=UPI0018CA9003